MTLRHRVFLLFEGDPRVHRAAAVVRQILGVLILASVAAVVLETVPAVRGAAPGLFAWLDTLAIAVFSVEYVLRVWTAPEDPRFRGPVLGRLRWMVTPAALVDLVAIAPGWLPETAFDLRAVRLLRLFRIVRVAKLGRYSLAVQTLQNVLRTRAADLLSLLLVLLVMLVVASTIMFFVEHDAQPKLFSSIPATMWWGIVTLTTVGYGDMTPVTDVGRIFGGAIAILGIGMFALPAGLLGAAFVEELAKARARHHGHGQTCPHCGKPVG